MTLDEFLIEEHARLDLFAAMWRSEVLRQPEAYPTDMPPGEWDEQLQAFDPAYEGDGG